MDKNNSSNGLRNVLATSIQLNGPLGVGRILDQGNSGEVLASSGVNKPPTWVSNSAITPQSLTMGTNVNLTSGATSWNGQVADTINVPPFYDTTYEEGMGIEIDYTGIPEPIISTRTDNFTINAVALGAAPKNLNVLRVPNDLIAGTNITFTGAPPGTNYNGSAPITITSQDTVLTAGNAIQITAGAIDWKPDNQTLGISGAGYGECLKVPNELQAGANIVMTSDYDGSNVVSISATDTNTEYTGGDGIIVNNITESIDARLDSITLEFNGSSEIEVLKVPNNLSVSSNLVMTGPASFDGASNAVISLDDNIFIEGLQVDNASAFNYVENMNTAIGNSTTTIQNLNSNLFQNGITGAASPTQLQGASPGGFVVSGGGTTTNGFNSLLAPESTAKYFAFSGGTNGSNRWIRTKNIRTLIQQGGEISCYFIQGNSSNGGENSDTNENLVFEILTSTLGTAYQYIVSLGSTGYVGNLFTLFNHTLTAGNISAGYYFQFRQTAHSGSSFDNYGIKYIRFSSGDSDVRFLNLPTSVPSETGRIWNNSGVLNIV